jgi:pimeloyl-ACP methyl ester carboxylesterase
VTGTRTHTIEFAGAGGLRLAADCWGDESRPAIVCLPGGGQTRHSWHRTAKSLTAQGYYAISVDLRGHGDSDWAADGNYSVDAFVGDVLAIREALPSPPILVGASIGGIAAAIAVGESNMAVARALVLVDVVPDMATPGLDRIRAFMSAGRAGFAGMAEAAAAVASYLPHRQAGDSPERLKNSLRARSDGRLYWHWDPAFHAGSGQRSAQGMFARMAAACARIRIPVLLVSGARSEVVDQTAGAQLLELITHAHWVQVPEATHMVAGDRNEVFSAALDTFLADWAPAHAPPAKPTNA